MMGIFSTLYRYDSTTGTFTVPAGGDGFYYFSMYFLINDGEGGLFDMELNEELFCTAYAEQIGTTVDEITTSCSAIAHVSEGKKQYRYLLLTFKCDI